MRTAEATRSVPASTRSHCGVGESTRCHLPLSDDTLGNSPTTSSARRATRLLALAVAAALLLTGAAGVQPASAGTYVMRSCNVPGHGSAPMHPWRWLHDGETPIPGVSLTDACASGGGIGVTLANRQMPNGRAEGIGLDRPTGPQSQIKFVKAMLWYAARLTGSGPQLRFIAVDYRSDGTTPVGLSNYAPGSEYLVAEQLIGSDSRHLYLQLYCEPPNGLTVPEPCVAAHNVPLLIRGIEVTLSEDIPPDVLPPRGNLLDGGLQSGVRTLTYSASDPQSGLRTVEVLLGETVVASQDFSPRCAYADFTVCPAALDDNLQVDTRLVANGSHGLTVRVRDAAGNERVVNGGGAVNVANGPTPTSSAVSTYTLSARFKSTSRSTVTVPYGRRVAIQGRLAQASGRVAAGSVIDVLERRDRRGAREVTRARVKTKADGSFSVALVTTRPSRTIRLAYRPTAGSHVLSRALKLRVRAGSRVRASLRGSRLRFSGHVLSAPIPKVGKRVVMEGRSPGSAWTPFNRLRTDRKGRFSGTYRLRVRRPGVRLQVRALVPSESGYGYLANRSRAVTLRVR